MADKVEFVNWFLPSKKGFCSALKLKLLTQRSKVENNKTATVAATIKRKQLRKQPKLWTRHVGSRRLIFLYIFKAIFLVLWK
mmetsp:Transcript_17284/g.22614  ORF Transcript_17284/g.22614 Transcript_17284/m.22614 type:complete len:82 (+) Transcript_17284:1990-2235(+)